MASNTNSDALEQINELATKVEKLLKTDSGKKTVHDLKFVLDIIRDNADKINSDDAYEVISGLLAVVSAISKVEAVLSTISQIGMVCRLFSVVLGAAGGNEGVGPIVKKVIEEAFEKYDDDKLREEAKATESLFSTSSAFLSGIKEIRVDEIAALTSYVPIYHGVKFLEILAQRIDKHMIDGKYKNIMTYVDIYCKLAVLRLGILYRLLAILEQSGHADNIRNGLRRVIESQRQRDKSVVTFLVTPKIKYRDFYLDDKNNLSKWPIVKAFVTGTGLELQDLSYLHGSKYIVGTVTKSETRFAFEFESTEINNTFRLKHNFKEAFWWGLTMFMDDKEVYFHLGLPNSDKWEVVKFHEETEFYLIFNRQNWHFLYISVINMLGSYQTYPGESGHLTLKRA